MCTEFTGWLLTVKFRIDDYSLYTIANYDLSFRSIDLDSVRYRYEDALVVQVGFRFSTGGFVLNPRSGQDRKVNLSGIIYLTYILNSL